MSKLKNTAQPPALYLLFFTELWERFGFYTVQTIIILYMTKGLLMPDNEANLLYASFSSLLYITPVIGGYLADKFMGFQRTITLGGILFTLAYLICAFNDRTMFFLGLSILICANGFFKPNVSSIVGELYGKEDPRRDGGFTIFYMGINVGALIPPLIAGTLVDRYGWHAGFLLAAAGMILGQLTFLFGKKYLHGAGTRPENTKLLTKHPIKFYTLLFIGLLLCIGLCMLAFHYPTTTNAVVEITAVLLIGLVLFYLIKEPMSDRKKMLAALVLIIISAAFWSLYNQTFTSLMLFADRNMEKHFLGFPFDAEATQFFNPFFIIVLSPVLSRLWINLDRVSLNPSTQSKFFLGLFFLCFGFLFLAFCTKFFNQAGLVSPSWLAICYLLQTVGELLISPIGLAMITVLSPKHLVGMMMGVWFFAQAASFAVGGFLANIAALPKLLPPTESIVIYTHAFFIYGLIALGMTLVSLALIPLLNRLIKD